MFVQIDDNDRRVLVYDVPADDTGRTSGSRLVVIHDINVTGDYMALFRGRDAAEGQWDLMWKGNISTVLQKVSDEIETWERDAGLSK